MIVEDKKCPTCKFPVVLHEFHGMTPYEGCSEFCATVTDKERAEFLAAKPGDWCVFPCGECGHPLEDEWFPDDVKKQICSSCHPKVQLRDRTALLEAAMPFTPVELRARIEEALKR